MQFDAVIVSDELPYELVTDLSFPFGRDFFLATVVGYRTLDHRTSKCVDAPTNEKRRVLRPFSSVYQLELVEEYVPVLDRF